jgi:HSP20 family protein
MFLTKYRPSTSLESLFDTDFFPIFGKCMDSNAEKKESFRLPRTNINESETEFALTMEMPGVKKDDVDVSIEKDQIIITGGLTEKVETEGLRRGEIRSESFRRSFMLDSTIDRDTVKARLENGILKVTLPKKAESVGRKIDVD